MALAFDQLCPLLQVFDMPTSIRFYRDILGFVVVHSDRPGDDCDWTLLRRGAAELMLNTQYERAERPPAPNPARRNAHRDVCLYFASPDLEQLRDHLLACGLEVAPPVTRDYGMRQLSLEDPDGYGLCFQVPVSQPSAG